MFSKFSQLLIGQFFAEELGDFLNSTTKVL